jgi:glycosyltransferase involved in cell wall biosynthesis
MRVQIHELLRIMKQSEVELTFGYSTMSNRVKNLQLPHKSENREFIVLVQNPNEESYVFNVPQSKLVELKSKGVAKSRNAALKYASGKYLIFGDDDITFVEEGINKLLQYFEANPECSIILAQTSDETGILRKSYPTKQHKLTKYNSAKAATYEMMVRTDAIREAGITFDENFGAGADNYLGDEYIFIADALNKGLKGVFIPVRVAIHPKESSGSGWGTQRDLTARAAVFTRVFGAMAPIFRALFLLKSRKGRVGFLNALRFIIGR